MMKIFDAEFEIDFFDADILERYETAVENYQKNYAEVTRRQMSAAETVRSLCDVVFDFMDEVFGDGAAKQIFGDECNLRKALMAMQTVNREAAKQREELEQDFPEFTGQSPAVPQNRAQRRLAKKS